MSDQKTRFDNLTAADRKVWGFTESSLSEQQKADEANNPSGGAWLLTVIDREGHTAEMGGLMYEFSASKLVGGARSMELAAAKVYERLRAKGTESAGQQKLTEGGVRKEKVYPKELLNFALCHREGHVDGLQRFQEETGTDLLKAVLANAEEKGEKLNTKALIYQTAALIESARDNDELRDKLLDTLGGNTVWQEKVVKGNATKGLKITGLKSEELQSHFPGAEVTELPEPSGSRLSKLYKKWQSVVAKTTYNRASHYLKEFQTATEAQEIADTIVSQV